MGNKLQEQMEATKANVLNASASGTGDSLASNPEMVRTAELYDKGTRDNDKELAELADKNAKLQVDKKNLQDELNKVNGEDSLFGASTAESREQAKKEIQNSEASKILDKDIEKADTNLKNIKKDYEDTLDDNLAQLNQATEEEAAVIANNYQQQLASHDPNTEEGRAALLAEQKNYEDIVNNSEAYQAWIDNYNSALFLTAVSQGLGAAFGVPGIDFTKHPSIEQAKSNLDRLKNAYEGEKKKKGELEDKIVETKNDSARKTLENKKAYLDKSNELAKNLVDDARSTKNSTELAKNMTDAAAYGQFRNDEYMLESYDASREKAKRDKRNESSTGKSIPESAALMIGDVVGSTAKGLGNVVGKL